mmetsp:Transcript_848/g.2303  ORF Transcript_848/g.2303 Transcript_848/m.2303 type:complete len:383 (+) Transcript_848:130-1278(+)
MQRLGEVRAPALKAKGPATVLATRPALGKAAGSRRHLRVRCKAGSGSAELAGRRRLAFEAGRVGRPRFSVCRATEEGERRLKEAAAPADADVVPGADAEVEVGSSSGGNTFDLAVKVGAAVAFGAFIDVTMGFDKAEEYFTGYILEQTLSVDNLFVFILLFDYFKVPEKGKERVLSFGIYTAAVLRGVLIVLGSELVEKFEPVLLVFAGILLYSAYDVLFKGEDEEEEEDLNDSPIVKFCKQFIDVSDEYDGDNFFTVQNGVKLATPLLLVLAVVELSDLIFAVDSIPAVFGVTKDPFIVYTSNMFAIVGLRSLFGVVSSAMAKLKYLEKAVGTVLGFVGLKMVADFGGFHISNEASLLVVCSIVGAGVGFSILSGEEPAES